MPEKAKKTESGEPARRFTLGLSSLAALLFLSIAAICVAYITGVMTGRHGQIEQPVSTATESAKTGEQTVECTDQTLAARDLEFARILRGLPEQKPVVEEPVANTPAQEEPRQESRPALPDDDKIYDFVFQMGAFRDEAAVDKLRQQLEGYGLRTSMEKNGKIFIVLVRLRGDSKRAEEILDIAQKLRLGSPIIRSRKEIANP